MLLRLPLSKLKVVQIPTLSVRVALRRLSRRRVSTSCQRTGITLVVRKFETVRLFSGMQTGSVVRPRLMLVVLRELIKLLKHTSFSVMAAQVKFSLVKKAGRVQTVQSMRLHTMTLLERNWGQVSKSHFKCMMARQKRTLIIMGQTVNRLDLSVQTQMGTADIVLRVLLRSMNRMVVLLLLAGQHLLQTFHGFLRQGKRR